MNVIHHDVVEALVSTYKDQSHEFGIFVENVHHWFAAHPRLNCGIPPTVHSVKSRLKEAEHLRDKLKRKWNEQDPITPDNLFQRITDLGGVRVLHLHQEQFTAIHSAILDKVLKQKDWVLGEQPCAYTWDPESTSFFASHDLKVEVKESFYTSVHYLVKPRDDSPLCCEIQVRTLFEEIWGEVDHSLNYPTPTDVSACREQLRVLAKLVGAGSRLVDSIFTANKDQQSKVASGDLTATINTE